MSFVLFGTVSQCCDATSILDGIILTMQCLAPVNLKSCSVDCHQCLDSIAVSLFTNSMCVCVCVCVFARVCVCAWVCLFAVLKCCIVAGGWFPTSWALGKHGCPGRWRWRLCLYCHYNAIHWWPRNDIHCIVHIITTTLYTDDQTTLCSVCHNTIL